jgi:toxin secretion/phage lysis holin
MIFRKINMTNKFLISGILASIMSFYSPVHYLMIPVLWLVVIDIITGIYLAKFIKKEDITSRGLFRKVPQLFMFFLAMTASMHADPFLKEFGLETLQGAKFVISFYGLYELFSILENLGQSGLPVAKQISNILKAKLPQDLTQRLDP